MQVDRLLAIVFSPFFFARLKDSSHIYPFTFIRVFSLLYLFMLFSFMWTPDKEEAIKQLVYYPVHFLLFLEIITFAITAQNPLKAITRGWLFSVLVCSIVAFWEITSGNHLSVAKEQGDAMNTGAEILEHMTASVTFNNYNSFVTYLCFCFPWIFYILISVNKSFVVKLLSIIALISSVLIIVLNASRGGVLSIFIMLIVYFILSKKSFFKNVITMISILLISYIIINYGESITAVIAARVEDGGMFEDESRAIIWHNSLLAFSDTWGIGVGIGGLRAAIEPYAQGGITAAHNLFLEILVQYGIIITLVFIWFMWLQFIKSITIEKSRRISLMMTFIAFPVYTIIDSGYLLNTHFYVLIATIYIFANYEFIKDSDRSIRETA